MHTRGQYGHRVITEALDILRDPLFDPRDREQAAMVARVTARYVTFDESLTSDLMRALSVRPSEPRVVQGLVNAARRCPAADRLAEGVQRLAVRAHEDELQESFVILVGAMQLVPTWRQHLHAEWLIEGIQRALMEEPHRSALHLLEPMADHNHVQEYLLEAFERGPFLVGLPVAAVVLRVDDPQRPSNAPRVAGARGSAIQKRLRYVASRLRLRVGRCDRDTGGRHRRRGGELHAGRPRPVAVGTAR